MKTIKKLMLVFTILLFGCNQNPKLQTVIAEDTGDNSLSTQKVDFPDPRPYSHIHTGDLVKSADGLSIKSGRLVRVETIQQAEAGIMERNSKISHQHKVISYLPFLNTKNLTEQELLSVSIAAPPTDRTLFFKTTEFEMPSETGKMVKIKVAYDLVIK